MAKSKMQFRCSSCGATYPKHEARCGRCGEWDTLEAESSDKSRPTPNRRGGNGPAFVGCSQLLTSNDLPRLKTMIPELDLVLGGGFAPGSVVLLAGSPGVGKSTMLLQMAQGLNRPVHYCSGEESVQQIISRARRVGVSGEHLQLTYCNELEELLGVIADNPQGFVIIDSVQTVTTQVSGLSPAGPSVLRMVAQELCEAAKTHGTTLLLVGHITKDGSVAGPKYLEHLVDVVLTLDLDDMGAGLRLIHAQKNRFGSTDDIGLLRMTSSGLKAADFSTFISTDRDVGVAKTIIAAGTRLIPAEVQALVTKSYGDFPKRVSFGVEHTRLQLILAVLERHCQIAWWDYDVHVTTTGGLSVREGFADLAIAAALISALENKPLGKSIYVGEIQLTGRVRTPDDLSKRSLVAKGLGLLDPPKIDQIRFLNERSS